MAYRFIPRMLDVFHTRYPSLRVDLLIADEYLDLAKGEADIALRAGESKDSSLISRKLADTPWAIYASRSYVGRHGRAEAAADLNRHAVIAFDGYLATLRISKMAATGGSERCDHGTLQPCHRHAAHRKIRCRHRRPAGADRRHGG